jgi:hypothetical protein
LAGWRWLFIIEGAGSFVAGLAALLLLPDFPGTASGSTEWLFSESELALAIDRNMFSYYDLTNILVSLWIDDDPIFIHPKYRVQMTFAILYILLLRRSD